MHNHSYTTCSRTNIQSVTRIRKLNRCSRLSKCLDSPETSKANWYNIFVIMSSHCILCDRSFDKDESLQQHLRDSPAHISSCHCEACNRSFSSEEALEQHLRDSPFHAPTFNCETCDRSFGDDGALEQHLRDSPVHARTFSCETCDRSFRGQEALEQHLRDSPVHTTSFDCESCDRSFISEEALEQHLRDSPAHAPSFNCETCDRSFVSEDALKQHLRDSSIHRQTPLDVFFRSFPTFDYDRFLPPAASYANLQKHEGLRRGQPESKAAWNDYQHALREELEMWFGAEDDLTAWHALCLAIGIEPLPKTCGQCEQVRESRNGELGDRC